MNRVKTLKTVCKEPTWRVNRICYSFLSAVPDPILRNPITLFLIPFALSFIALLIFVAMRERGITTGIVVDVLLSSVIIGEFALIWFGLVLGWLCGWSVIVEELYDRAGRS